MQMELTSEEANVLLNALHVFEGTLEVEDPTMAIIESLHERLEGLV